MTARAVAIIPARMASTRLPGKPLLDICGRPMIQWVYERTAQSSRIDRVIVATPDPEIAEAVRVFGGTAEITSCEHRSGTDRLAEIAAKLDDGLIVNVQGDEPLIEPRAIDSLVQAFDSHPALNMASLMRRITPREAVDPNLVKVVVDLHGFALYFSRAPIPCIRGRSFSRSQPAGEGQSDTFPIDGSVESSTSFIDSLGGAGAPPLFGHIGIYAYTRSTLLALASLPQTPLEIAESLEQLRAVENGFRILMIETDFSPVGVDTAEDLERARELCRRLEERTAARNP